MKAYVDKDLCTGCGLCESTCPDVFELDDDGIAVAKDIELKGELLEDAETARDDCPVEAIDIK